VPRFIYCYAECRYVQRRYAQCHYAECRHAEYRHAECRYVECRYARRHYALVAPKLELLQSLINFVCLLIFVWLS
jgi:hypothetical protein